MNRIVRIGLNRRKMSFEIHLAEHCNLNCKGCDNYSPVAEEEYVEQSVFQKEMAQMQKIFGVDGIEEIRILGGEPLLHSNIAELLRVSREIFPKTRLTIITNGVLLPKMGEPFYEAVKKNEIQILVTKYPIEFDYDGILEKLNKDGIKCGAFNTEPVKTLFKKPLDPTGSKDRDRMFGLCMNANHCISLKDGKLYTCSTIPNTCHLNAFFNCNFEVSEEDYIDIFKVTDKKEIRRRLSRPVPFCKYCDIEHEEFRIKWETSKKELSEWV